MFLFSFFKSYNLRKEEADGLDFLEKSKQRILYFTFGFWSSTNATERTRDFSKNIYYFFYSHTKPT